MKRAKYLVSAVLASAVLMLSLALPKVSATQVIDQEEEEKITICHRTNSVNNPYLEQSVNKSAGNGKSVDDHTQHTGPVAYSTEVAQTYKDNKIKWGDIIPPFGDFQGLNWDQVGQDVWEGGCLGGDNEELTEVVPAAVTFQAPTCSAKGSYTVPETENVEYSVDGNVVAAGTYEAQNGTSVTVAAEAEEGYFIGDETDDSWSYTFTAASNCGQTLGTQVTVKPTGAVKAGGGGAASLSGALFGLIASVGAVLTGLVLRKRATQ